MQQTLGWWSLIDVAVIGGVALVLPICLGHRWRWLVAALAAAVACPLPAGTAGAYISGGVWAVVAAGVLVERVGGHGPLTSWRLEEAVAAIGAGYALTAAAWFELSRLGATPLGIAEPIVELTAVHFTYVGVGALTLALAALARSTSRAGHRTGVAAVVLTAGAPLVVALGFVSHSALAQIGGAVLVSAAVFCTAGLELVAAIRPGPTAVRMALALSGVAVWAPMVLAVQWASAQHIGVWALGIDAMVRTHGALNALGFVAAGLVALHLERRRAEACHEEVAWS